MIVRKIYLPHSLSALNLTEGNRHPLLRLVHKQLNVLGFYEGPLDDTFTVETREALACYQANQGLNRSGLLSPVTFCRLYDAPANEITPVDPGTRYVDHALPRANILIAKGQRRLTLFDGNKPVRQYPIGIGKPATPTPEGNYAIATKVMNPGGVLGSRWMGLNYDTYGIHGTSAPWLIGQMVSNGCIRMHNANAEELFILVRLGTPVFIRQ